MGWRRILRSKWFYILISVLMAALLLRHVLSVRKSIEQTTQIDLPCGTETVETADNYEYTSQGKFLIPESEIRSFIREYNLQPLSNTPAHQFSTILLSKKHQPVVDRSKPFFFLEDCHEQNTWRVLLNERTGELWIVVDYPDMAGDNIPCPK